MKIKTSELKDRALDLAVEMIECEGAMYSGRSPRAFCTDWAWGGPIIERERLDVTYEFGDLEWVSEWFGRDEYASYRGPTPLIAAMRCYVASHLGDEIEVPEELK